MFDSFLYQDADDNSVTAQPVGVGDGSTASFQMIRSFGNFVELILAPIPSSASIFVNGILSNSANVFPWGSTTAGLLSFGSAPATSAAITATFSYYFPCRFVEDSMDFEKFMNQLWQGKKVGFISLKSS